jgi:hypothetical protein
MLYDPLKAQTRRKEAMRRELNRPVVVRLRSLSLADLPAARDAAVLAWFDRLCEFYDIEPTAPARWEQLAMRLAIEQFPDFALVTSLPKVGNPGSKEAVMNLFHAFQNYELPRRGGSKYKNFLIDHRAACEACKIKTVGSLKEAMRRGRQRREADRRGQELLIRAATMKALGIKSAVEFD